MRIEVEPHALIDAGKQVGSLGAQLGALSDAMSQVLSSGIASGADPAGLNFGISYGRQADQFGQYLAQAANAFKNVGLMLEATGYNYQHADQASTAGGPGPSGSVSGEPAETTAGDAPYGPNGTMVSPPTKYYLITPFLRLIPVFGMAAGVAMTWPIGNSAMMNVTAAQWRNIGQGLKVFEPALNAAKMAVGAQSIPEGATIVTALSDLGGGATALAGVADGMAASISDFAADVLETQDAIRDLLNRISLDGLWDTVTGILSGDGDRVLREIAEDVGTVLENFQNQVKGVLGLLDELTILLGEAADAFQKWIRPVLVEAFGDTIGNQLADNINLYNDIQVGVANGVIGLVAGTIALADPDTWKGLADTAVMLAKDPTMLDDVLKQAGSEFIALDEITGDNPGRGIGEAGFNIASLLIPGGALAKGGSVAKGLAATRNLLQKGELGSLGKLPGLGGTRTPDMPELPDVPGVPHVPEFTPPRGIPGSVLSPTPIASSHSGSVGGNAPTGPTSNSPGPSQSGGGARPGSPSFGGPAPTGSSPSAVGGGAPVSPSISSPTDSPGSSGPGQPPSRPSLVGGGDGPSGPLSNGSGSDLSGGSHDAVSPSNTTNGGGSDPSMSQKPDVADGVASSSGPGPHDGDAEPNSPDPSHSEDDGSFRPADDGRTYTLSDGSSHQTSFAPEQLGDNQQVTDALSKHGVSQRDFIDLVQRPTDTLTPDERDLINAVRDELSAPGPEAVMQKVIPPGFFDADGNLQRGRAEDYLEPPNEDFKVNGVGGSVTVAGDSSHLGTPAQIHDGLRLDYSDTPYTPHDAGTHIIRFQADLESPGAYDVPRNSDMGGTDRYDSWDDPFTGNGFTKSGGDVIPEYFATGTRMRDGAEMWEVLDDGTQRLVAILDRGSWTRQGNPDE